jgi:hypothetical protein
MLLFKLEKTFTKEDDATHKRWSFDVPEGAERLTIDFSFDPPHCGREEGIKEILRTLSAEAPGRVFSEVEVLSFLNVKNHVVLSLDSPDGWVGTRHFCNPKQHFEIAADYADYGFKPAALTAGRWEITLSFNSVVSDELNCRLSAEVLL